MLDMIRSGHFGLLVDKTGVIYPIIVNKEIL